MCLTGDVVLILPLVRGGLQWISVIPTAFDSMTDRFLQGFSRILKKRVDRRVHVVVTFLPNPASSASALPSPTRPPTYLEEDPGTSFIDPSEVADLLDLLSRRHHGRGEKCGRQRNVTADDPNEVCSIASVPE